MNQLAHTIAEVRALTGIGRTTIYDLIRTGKLPARKLGKKTLILHHDLRELLERLPGFPVVGPDKLTNSKIG
jgi:excisionase family DNA binding protein